MTSPTGPGPLSVGSPAAVLAIVPHLLGFAPDKSLVILGAGQPRGRIHVTFRFDLPDPPDPDATAAIAAHAVTLLSRQELTMAIVIGYGPGPLVTPLADAIRDAVSRNRSAAARCAARGRRPLLVLSVPRAVLLPTRRRALRHHRTSSRPRPWPPPGQRCSATATPWPPRSHPSPDLPPRR